jgi:hypothetical protein
MRSACKYCLAALCVVLLFPVLHAEEFSKTLKKEYDITPIGNVYLYNKYGKMDVKTWDKNRVKVTVTILVREENEEEAQRVFDAIKINFSNGSDYVKAETLIEPLRRNWSWWGDKSDYKINYEVYMPSTLNLNADQKYGDLYAEPISGKAKVVVKYGNFKVESVGDGSSFELGYGNGTVGKAKNAYFGVSYSKLNVSDAEEATVNSAYSGLVFGNVDLLNTTAKYDNYTITNAKNLKVACNYTKVQATNVGSINVSGSYNTVSAADVSRNLDLDMRYGSASLGLGKGLSGVTVNTSYTDVILKINSDLCCYELDASATYAGIRYPQAMNVTYQVEKPSSHVIKGYVGPKTSSLPVIKASLSYGGIKVLSN